MAWWRLMVKILVGGDCARTWRSIRGRCRSALEDKLRRMGYTIPPPFKFPNPNRTGCVVVGSIVFVSGPGRDLPSPPDVKPPGQVGRDLPIEEGYATARAGRLPPLPSPKQEPGARH